MSVVPTWRSFLKELIRDPLERDRLARETGMSATTLIRWANGTSLPRVQSLRYLLRVLHPDKQEIFVRLLREDHIDIDIFEGEQESTADESTDEMKYLFMRQILEMRAFTPPTLLFWTCCRTVLLQALQILDAEQFGMAITIACCMPPSSYGFVRSLREIIGFGTPPWPGDLSNQLLFLGAESLAGYVVTHLRAELIDDLRQGAAFVPVYRVGYEVSAAAIPIMYAGRVAGCVLFASARPGHFRSRGRLELMKDYAHCIALACAPEQFYAPDQLQLQIMPFASVQQAYFATLQERIQATMRDAANRQVPLTRLQAEEIVWRIAEEELIIYSS